MRLFESYKPIGLWLLPIVLAAVCLFAAPVVAGPISPIADPELLRLPPAILAWYDSETNYVSRLVDKDRLSSPAENESDRRYLPENHTVFDIKGVWIPETEMRIFDSGEMSLGERAHFERLRDGRREYLLLIHPESENMYGEILASDYEQVALRAVTLSSHRSLMLWKPGREDDPFLAKVSLNKKIGNVVRTLKGTEAARSVGVSSLLHGAGMDSAADIVFVKEPFAMIPKGMQRGAMIVRTFPKELMSGESQFVPLFALYGGHGEPLINELVRASGLAPEVLVNRMLIRPFVKLWMKFELEEHLAIEAHAQNMLVEIRDGQLTGRFMARDFGGFNFDLGARRSEGLFVPAELPTFESEADYFSELHQKAMVASLNSYFGAGFLYPLAISLTKTHRRKIDLEKSLRIELSAALTKELRREQRLKFYRDVIEPVTALHKLRRMSVCDRRLGVNSGR